MHIVPLGRSFRRLSVSDPGSLRLRSAASTALSAASAMGVLLVLSSVTGGDVRDVLLGTVIAVQASAVVKDGTQFARVVTTVAVPLPAVAAVALAAWLDEFGVAAAVVFIAVLFGAVWARRWGPRGNALGMVTFISYFFTLFLQPELSAVPMLCGAIVVGAGCALLVRTVVLPERPRLEIRRLARALRASSVEVLAAVEVDADARDLARLRRRLDRMGVTALMIEDWIDRHEGTDLVSVTGGALSLMLFEAQIATEQVASTLWRTDPSAPRPPELDEALGALRSVLRDYATPEALDDAYTAAASAARKADSSTPAGVAILAARRAVQAHGAIQRVSTRAVQLSPWSLVAEGIGVGRPTTPEGNPAAEVMAESGMAEAGPKEDRSDGGQRSRPDRAAEPASIRRRSRLAAVAESWEPSTRAAVQVAVATSIATLVGTAVSPGRWYWAVLTAFLVFNGTSTRGEILSRAGHRIVGTVAGVFAGVVIAALVGQNQPVQLALILVCIFFAFYFAPVAYGLLTFCVTIVLAMLYGLLGMFSLDVLGLRIVETAVGAVVGLASAYFIFATSTRGEMETKTLQYLDLLDEMITESIEAVLDPGVPREGLVAATRQLDQELQAVLTAAKPLHMRPATQSRRGVKRFSRVLTVANRSAHQLARAGVMATRADPGTRPSDVSAEALRQAGANVRGTLDLLRRGITEGPASRRERTLQTSVLDVLLTSTQASGALRLAVRSLASLNRTVFEALM